MPKYTQKDGEFILLKEEQDTVFELGHTYVPLGNKDEDLSGCMIQTIPSSYDNEIAKQYKHSDSCGLCRVLKDNTEV